jgi:hypothetical protein
MAATLVRLIAVAAAATVALGHAVVKVPTPRVVSAQVCGIIDVAGVGLPRY